MERLRAQLLRAAKGGRATVPIPVDTTHGRIDGDGRVTVLTGGRWTMQDFGMGSAANFNGILELKGGGDVFSQTAVLADEVGASVSVVDIQGQESLWDIQQQLIAGDVGAAFVSINDKAIVNAGTIVIGNRLAPRRSNQAKLASLAALRFPP